MDNNFKQLFEKVEEIKNILEERDKLKEKRGELLTDAQTLYNSVVESYQENEKQIIDRMKQEEIRNQNNKNEIVVLTRQQLKAESSGSDFLESDRLKELKEEVATYPMKMEALESLRNEIVISADDNKKMSCYESEWMKLSQEIDRLCYKIQDVLLNIRDVSIFGCLTSMEFIPGRNGFMKEKLEMWKTMRMEEMENEA